MKLHNLSQMTAVSHYLTPPPSAFFHLSDQCSPK